MPVKDKDQGLLRRILSTAVRVPNMTGTATAAGTALRDVPLMDSTVGREALVAGTALAPILGPAVVANEAAVIGGPGLGAVAGKAALDTGVGLLGYEAVDRVPYLWHGNRLSEDAGDYAERGVRYVMPDGRAEDIVASGAKMAAPFLLMGPEGIVGHGLTRMGADAGTRFMRIGEEKLAKWAAERGAKKEYEAMKSFAKENGLGMGIDNATGQPVLMNGSGVFYYKNGKLEPLDVVGDSAGSAALPYPQSDVFNPYEWENYLAGHPQYVNNVAGMPESPASAFKYVPEYESDALADTATDLRWTPQEYWNQMFELNNKYKANPPKVDTKLPPPPPEVHNPVTGAGTSGVVDDEVYNAIKANSGDFDIDKFIDQLGMAPVASSPKVVSPEDANISDAFAKTLTPPKTPATEPSPVGITPMGYNQPIVSGNVTTAPNEGHVMRTIPQNIMVSTPEHEQVRQIMEMVKRGEMAPFENIAYDVSGEPVAIPDWWAAALRTDAAKKAYPEGVDYFWRGFSQVPGWMNGLRGYQSFFGGQHELAKGYRSGFNLQVSNATPSAYSTEGGIPNMYLLTIPKGKLRDVPTVAGQNWGELFEPTPENMALMKKYYSGVPDASGDYYQMTSKNPLILDGYKVHTTDDISRLLAKPVSETPGMEYPGVVLRGIHDGNVGDEVIWNPSRGGFPKIVHPGSSFKFQLGEQTYLKNGGQIHIKPSHRGRLTELKARTGKSEAELYNDGNPAHRKMVVFARNARKWKHADGGFLHNYYEDGGPFWQTGFNTGKPEKKNKPKYDHPVSWYVQQKPEDYPGFANIRSEYLDKYFTIDENGRIKDNTAREEFYRRKKEVRGTTGSIPYNNDNEIMLTTDAANARYRTGRISTDVLDYIYDNAAKAGVPIREALGLAGKESTLGIGRGYKRGSEVSPIDLYSYWYGVGDGNLTNKEGERLYDLYKRMYDGEQVDMQELDKAEEKFRGLTENLHDYTGTNLVKDAYDYYKKGKYNPGEKGYNEAVLMHGDAILSDPAVQKWLKTKKTYEGRGFAGGGTLNYRLRQVYGDDTKAMLAAVLRAKNIKKQ